MLRAASLLCLITLIACTEGNESQDTPMSGCEPDEVAMCACPNGEMGQQLCTAEHTFGACLCGDAGLMIDTGPDPDGGPQPDLGNIECNEGNRQLGPCGNDGEQSRECVDGTWGPWGDCVESCEEGLIEIEPCGVNERGERRRTCTNTLWSTWEECLDPDVCTDGAQQVEPCGVNDSGERQQVCTEGQWGEFGPCEGVDECVDGATQSEACGFNDNGRRERSCQGGHGLTTKCSKANLSVGGLWKCSYATKTRHSK